MKDAAFQQRIQIELLKLLYKQIPFVLVAESLAAISLYIVLYGSVNSHILITWLIANLLICGVARHCLVFYFKKATSHKELSYHYFPFWLMLFAIGAFCSGVSWGVASSVLMVPNDMARQTFTVFLTIGITACANLAYSPNRLVYAIFLFPAFIPFSIWLMLQGNVLLVLGALSLIYIFIMLLISYFYHYTLKTSLFLRFEKNDLIVNLVTAKKNLENQTHALEKTVSLVKATLESTADGILVISNQNNIEDFNQKLIQILKVPESILAGKKFNSFCDFIANQLTHPKLFRDKITDLKFNPEKEEHVELQFTDNRFFEYYSQPQWIGKSCVGHVLSFRDITNKKTLEDKLFHQANFDHLTNLPNRTLLLEKFAHLIQSAKSNAKTLAVFFIDIDRFKLINDTLGHTVGNKLLIKVANRLSEEIGDKNIACREGGDEFIIVLSSIQDETDAMTLAKHCITAIREYFFIDNNKINVTISLGMSFYPKDGLDPETLIKNADIAMYRAKELGRNNFQLYTKEMNKKILEHLLIENQLHSAIENNEFRLLYQPIVNLKTGQIVGLETLLRWFHPVHGFIQPQDFIPIAEQTGLILSIDEWVLRRAFEQAKIWQRNNKLLTVSVNISGRQFRQALFFNLLTKILIETNVDPHFIALELTEGVIMEDLEKNNALLNRIKKLGISIFIDDFGVGYSSLSYLKNFPIDKIKIDRSFIADVPKEKDDTAISAAIITLASKLNLNVIAEGVENIEQVKFLQEHHCNEAQGFYFANPLNADECTKLLNDNHSLLMHE